MKKLKQNITTNDDYLSINNSQNTFLDLFQSLNSGDIKNNAHRFQNQQLDLQRNLPKVDLNQSGTWKRKIFQIDPKQQRYFNHFKSISFQVNQNSFDIKPEPQKYVSIPKPEKISIIQNILNEKNQEIPKFTSNFGLDQYQIKNFIRIPALYSFGYSNQFQKENCYTIYQQLRFQNRDLFKSKHQGEKKQKSQQILDIKNLNTKVYQEVIMQKHNNQVFNSIIKNYGSISLDDFVQLPEKYEIKQKKDYQSIQINTDQMETQRFSMFNTIKKIDLFKLQIERQKRRKVKAKDYFKVMETKLIDFLDYVVKDQPNLIPLEVAQKIKIILKDLNKYKGKQVDGQLKTTLLLYFFREFKLLKDQKQQFQKKAKLQQQTKRKKKIQNNLSLKPAQQFEFKILPTSQKKPQTQNKKKNISSQNTKQQDAWIGILKQT